MKFVALSLGFLSAASAFQASSVETRGSPSQLQMQVKDTSTSSADAASSSRKQFLQASSILGFTAAVNFLAPEPAFAKGRATLEKSFRRYAPRVVAGGVFYGNELRTLVEKNDWEGIKEALQDPPERTKEDLNKPDAGVAARAKAAGGFSDARVLVAADLLAASFSDSSISTKTRKMQGAVVRLREAVAGLKSVARQGLGEETSGGLFGIGGKKLSQAELAASAREYYVAGGTAWNEFVYDANDELAIQFDRFPYVK
jgi:hypothetical protein